MKYNQQIFECILNDDTGDYAIQAIVLALMKPEGW